MEIAIKPKLVGAVLIQGFTLVYADNNSFVLNSRDGDCLKNLLFLTDVIELHYFDGFKKIRIETMKVKSMSYHKTKRSIGRYVLNF